MAVFRACCLNWDQTMVWVMKVIGTAIKRTWASTLVFSANHLATSHSWTMPLPESPGLSKASLALSLVGTLFLTLGFWCTQGFVCALQQSVSGLSKFYNQIPLAFKVKFSGDSQSLCWIPGWEICSGPRTSLTVQKFLRNNYQAICKLYSRLIYGGLKGDLLWEGLCHKLHDPGW